MRDFLVEITATVSEDTPGPRATAAAPPRRSAPGNWPPPARSSVLVGLAAVPSSALWPGWGAAGPVLTCCSPRW